MALASLDIRGGATVRGKKHSWQAAWHVGRDVVRCAAFAAAGNPPQLSVIVASAALELVLRLFPTRPAWMLRLE